MTLPDLGAQISYLALPEGVPVFDAGGSEEVGRVVHVLADEATDIFDGLVIEVDGTTRFADAQEVGTLHERGAVLTLDAAAIRHLPEPAENPAVVQARPGDEPEDGLQGKLRRAWDLLSGKY
jgi:hypothetical protein